MRAEGTRLSFSDPKLRFLRFYLLCYRSEIEGLSDFLRIQKNGLKILLQRTDILVDYLADVYLD